MTRLEWHKSGRDWFGIYGRFRATVRGANDFGLCRWSVQAGDNEGGSGATSSVRASKAAAEREVDRFAGFLKGMRK